MTGRLFAPKLSQMQHGSRALIYATGGVSFAGLSLICAHHAAGTIVAVVFAVSSFCNLTIAALEAWRWRQLAFPHSA